MRQRTDQQARDAKGLADRRWATVLARRADDSFVYAVRTTGIYCRSTCPSRRPKRENVIFLPTAADAEMAGYRACRRCHPETHEGDAALLQRLCRTLEEVETNASVTATLRAAGVDPSRARSLFRATLGLTPAEYVRTVRGQRLRRGLQAGSSVTAAAYQAGYGSSAAFYEEAPNQLGMPPAKYRRGAAGEEIRFAIGKCCLGNFAVAATERGVCAVLLGDDPEALLADLQDRFHAATLIGADRDFESTVAAVVTHLDGANDPCEVPLDIRGTAFQQRVWQAIARIPRGCTATYSEIAAALGIPRSVRAVATACGANPLAVLVPCHRVVRRDGGLGGYRWGLDRKVALQRRERPTTH